jgi:hypothetical protein
MMIYPKRIKILIGVCGSKKSSSKNNAICSGQANLASTDIVTSWFVCVKILFIRIIANTSINGKSRAAI